MEELVGVAATQKNGLMPTYRAMGGSYSGNTNTTVKFTFTSKESSEALGFLLTAVKNHENAKDSSIIFLTGYTNDMVASSVRKGSYIEKIAYKAVSSSQVELFVKLKGYVHLCVLCTATSQRRVDLTPQNVNNIPSDATDVPL